LSRDARHDYLEEAEFRAWHGCLQFTNQALRALDVALSAEHGISVKEFDVLITLYNASERRMRMSQLGDSVLLSPAGVTHLVTRLERDGLVRRTNDDGDRRSYFAELTDAGDQRLREARRTHNDVVRNHLVRRLTPAQLKSLGKLWTVVLES